MVNGSGIVDLLVTTPNGNVFKNEEVASLTAKAELWRGSTVDTTKVSYKWAVMDASVTATSSTGYDADFGIGWRKLSDTADKYTGTATNTLTVYAAAVNSYAVFKCCAQDTDSASASYNTKFFDVATFIDNSDPLQIIVTSTGGDVFKNGQGTTVLTAVCYQAGSEVDAAGNGSYTWTKYNKDGVVDTSWGTNGSKTGKTLSVSSADVDTKATFMVVVALWGGGEMIASAQFTIISLCDVVTSDTPPENPYEGQLWVDTSVTPPETKIWDGNEWVVQNDIETIRTTISILTEKDAQFQQTIDGLNSYVATLTETVETASNDQGVLEERVLNSESRVSELEHTVNGLSVTMQEQYIGGINYVQNSSGLNGITDDWSYSGTVKTDASTDTQNNTISDSCFVLGAYSSLSQYIRGVVPGTYTISVRAKKTSTMSGYFYVTYNGNKTKYLFNKSTAFDWTDYSVTLTDVTDPTLRIYCYCRDASIYLADIMISEGAIPRKWTPAPNEIYTQEVKIDKRGIEVSNSASSQRTVITNTEFAGYYNDEVIFTLNKDETQTKKTTVDGELTVGKTKFVPMPTASEGLNIVILD